MDWEYISPSVVRINNLPENTNETDIKDLLASQMILVEKIDIKDSYADVYLVNEADTKKLISLDKQEFQGKELEIAKISDEKYSDPEILDEDSSLEILKENNRPMTSARLKKILKKIKIKNKEKLPKNDYFELLMNCQTPALVTMVTLVFLVISDLFG